MSLVPQTLDGYRADLTQAVEDAKAGFTEFPLVIEYDNRITVEPGTQTDPILSVDIVFADGAQADLSDNPFHRVVGMYTLSARTKEGAGTAKSLRMLEHFYTQLQKRLIGQVNTEMAKPLPGKKVNAEWVISVIVPFYFNKVYA